VRAWLGSSELPERRDGTPVTVASAAHGVKASAGDERFVSPRLGSETVNASRRPGGVFLVDSPIRLR
jgi:hypothetical protein